MKQEPITKKLSDGLNEIIAFWGLSGAVNVEQHEVTCFTSAFGYSDREKSNIKNTSESTYAIKWTEGGFVEYAIMSLVEKGLLKLDDTIERFIPQYVHSGRITVENLLMHTSGIPDYANNVRLVESERLNRDADEDLVLSEEERIKAAEADFSEVIKLVGDKQLMFEPGKRITQDKSRTDWVFLSYIYESLSNESLKAYIQREFIDKLGLKSTAFGYFPSTVSYMLKHEDEHFRVEYNEENSEFLTLTIGELARIGTAMTNGSLLGSAAWKKGIKQNNRNKGILFDSKNGFYLRRFSALGTMGLILYDSLSGFIVTVLLNEYETYRYEKGLDRKFTYDIQRLIEELTTYPDKPEFVEYTRKNFSDVINLELSEEQYEYVDDVRSCLCFAYSDKKVKTFVLSDHGRAIGITLLRADKSSGEYHIEIIIIDRRYQNRGYGKVLLKKAIDWLTSKGAKTLEIEVVRSNEVAKRLYESVGFKVVRAEYDECDLRLYL